MIQDADLLTARAEALFRSAPAAPGESAVNVRAYLLGALRVVVDGQVIDTTSSRRSRNLIAYLLAHRDTPIPQDVLMDTFWPGASPAAARNSMHVALSGARRVLRAVSPAQVIERRFHAYQIAGSIDVWTDVDQFEHCCRAGRRAEGAGDKAAAAGHYEAAALLYRGDFLADEPYAEWALSRRGALRALALEVQSRLVVLYTGRGDYGPAATLARRVLADDPYNEGVHRGLMRCYARTGLRHLALLQYRQLVATLWETLRVLPARETTELYERLRRPEPMPRPA